MFRTLFDLVELKILLILIILLVVACEGPVGPAGQPLSGTISGYVYLIDDNLQHLEDNSGVRILVEEANSEAFSNTDGSWAIENLSAGTYTVLFEKEGYSYIRYFGWAFVGGGHDYFSFQTISPLANYSLTNLQADIHDDGSLWSYIDFVVETNTPIGQPTAMVVFVGEDENVSSQYGTYIFAIHGASRYTYNDTTDSVLRCRITEDTFQNYGVAPGQQLFVRAYASTTSGHDYYKHPGTNDIFYTGLGDSTDVMQITMPNLWE